MSKLEKPSEGYFLAKRQVQDSLNGRLEVLTERFNEFKSRRDYANLAIVSVEMEIVNNLRNHLRNSMLWDTEKGP